MENQVNITPEEFKKIKSSIDEKEEFNNLNFQIDFINSEVSKFPKLVETLNKNSTRLQHLLDEEPRLMRWWFESIEKAMSLMVKIDSNKNLNHRLICIEKNALFIQLGEFKPKSK